MSNMNPPLTPVSAALAAASANFDGFDTMENAGAACQWSNESPVKLAEIPFAKKIVSDQRSSMPLGTLNQNAMQSKKNISEVRISWPGPATTQMWGPLVYVLSSYFSHLGLYMMTAQVAKSLPSMSSEKMSINEAGTDGDIISFQGSDENVKVSQCICVLNKYCSCCQQ